MMAKDAPPAKSQDLQIQPPRVNLLGVSVDCVDMQEALDIVEGFIVSGEPHYVVTPNLHFVALADKNLLFRNAINNADLCLADGVPLLWISRLKRVPLKGRVNGTDFVHALCERLAPTTWPIFLLGTTEENNAAAARNLEKLYPGLKVAGRYSPPFGFEDSSESKKICNLIIESGAKVVFVAFSDPKRELWIVDNYKSMGGPVCIGIGGSLDFIAGSVRRAPVWMQRKGLEWFFRVVVEPRRLGKRYMRDIFDVFRIVIRSVGEKRH